MNLYRNVKINFSDITTDENEKKVVFLVDEVIIEYVNGKVMKNTEPFKVIVDEKYSVVNRADVVRFVNATNKFDYDFFSIEGLIKKRKFEEKISQLAIYLVDTELNPPKRKSRSYVKKSELEGLFKYLHIVNLDNALDISLRDKDKATFKKIMKLRRD